MLQGISIPSTWVSMWYWIWIFCFASLPQILHLNLPTSTPPPTFEMYVLKSRKFVIPWSTSPGPSHWRRSWAGSNRSPGKLLASDLLSMCRASASWGWTTNSCSSLICGTSPSFCYVRKVKLKTQNSPTWQLIKSSFLSSWFMQTADQGSLKVPKIEFFL